MKDTLAASNVDRSYSLAATSIAIFTFVLFFLHPQFASGAINGFVFQLTLIVMGLATFSLALAAFHYYIASLGVGTEEAERALSSRRGDRLWLTGCILLFFAPSLVLFSIGLVAVAAVWFCLWLVFTAFAVRRFPLVLAAWM